ncbi:zinc finger CCCH domain-containing protein 66 isoform X1 [Telopea speciosissima]|uniref:zinc finger CCCH domain-containing protein 66 isoform X1 n=1 Tax=Telopea speciosissima TaxID=54955 RepID=UPI001CC6EB06|nr:zinc finger CCCH domain-containing protein 66 isoform X1 [Telopea speciosissima]XP_043692173.1 zinc finger CCCH domain-containing protein 66 isoform X1 [Telopea speciosissima]
MPDSWQVLNNGVSASSNASVDNMEEAMWRLKIQTNDNHEGVAAYSSPYPDRPGEPDCIYYLKTGLCGYGSNCRFNHPAYTGHAALHRGELPERIGQPDCQYFLKTGTCKFGATCKYHHPRDRHDAGQVPLNVLGLPMRQEEKSCPYYMRTGACKFGMACKFHHPQPTALGAVLPVTGPATYGSTGSSVAPLSGLPYVGGLPAWSLPRAPYISGPRMQGPQTYMPVVLSPSQGIISTQQGWNTYTGTMSTVPSTDVLGSNMVFNSKPQLESGSSGQMHLLSTSASHFPERPDQPECQYFMKTGSCKFGSTCKYNHPKERIAPLATSTLGPLGLPLRPGQAVCTFYSMYGICKYGPTCKFDHPLTGYYNYSMSLPALSIPDQPLFAYQRNSPMVRSSETSPSKSSRLPDRITKSEATNTKNQNPDLKAPEDPPQGTSPMHNSSSSSEPQHEQSD